MRTDVPFAGSTGSDSALAGLTIAPSPRWLRDLGFAAVGAGALWLTLGSVLGVVAKTTYDGGQTHCHAATRDVDGVAGRRSAHALASVATASIVSGAVFVAGGVALLLVGPKSATAAVARNAVLRW